MKKEDRVNKIINDVNYELQPLEEQICQWMKERYDRNIRVAIELMQSGQYKHRPRPCNRRCNIAYEDDTLRHKCDMSDEAMKELLCKYVTGKGPKDTKTGVGYRCHMFLSNIVIPYFDKLVIGDFWYIFLGQFFLSPCFKGSDKKKTLPYDLLKCANGFKSEKIRVLTLSEINGMKAEYQDCLHEGFFYKENDCPDRKGVSMLCIPELLTLKVVVAEKLSVFLEKVHEDKKKRALFRQWARIKPAYIHKSQVRGEVSTGFKEN